MKDPNCSYEKVCIVIHLYVYSRLCVCPDKFSRVDISEGVGKSEMENKYVFVDCYTSWCGPCKMMAADILPLKEVGEYMNETFVCVKFDMEKGEGRDIQQKYKVSSYPTFLVLNVDGSLLHAVVGASATGKEFVARVKEAFDENSAGKLTVEYEKGNRDRDFLMTYIKALVKACDIEKAHKISEDVLASLSDDEKCTEPYWFIYENLDLSPIGSNNMMYLLQHVDQFRQGVGVEKVDSVVGNLFAIQLEDILRGRNRTATLEDVEAAGKMLESYHLEGHDYLNDYIALIKAVKTENTDDVVKLYKKVFSKMEAGKIAYLYFTPITTLKGKWSEKQKEGVKCIDKKDCRKRDVNSNSIFFDGLCEYYPSEAIM